MSDLGTCFSAQIVSLQMRQRQMTIQVRQQLVDLYMPLTMISVAALNPATMELLSFFHGDTVTCRCIWPNSHFSSLLMTFSLSSTAFCITFTVMDPSGAPPQPGPDDIFYSQRIWWRCLFSMAIPWYISVYDPILHFSNLLMISSDV